ncbi:MAG TPA: hypothetical protein VNU01_03350 [Egibacteraceae bacterium]|nr:hypothetical protein [Egibacteraceae bacterium]
MAGWLDAHATELAAGGALALALVGSVLAVLLARMLRQGRRALLGAQPVLRATRIVPGPAGGLRLEVGIENMAAWAAQDVSVGATVEGRPLEGGLTGASAFGVSPDGATAHGLRASFSWPVGVLDAAVEVRWSWRDGAGRHRAAWRGHLRTPAGGLPGRAAPTAPRGAPRA